jgi:hypothetical protein
VPLTPMRRPQRRGSSWRRSVTELRAQAAPLLKSSTFKDRVLPDAWRVEKMETDGAIEVAIFSGPRAYERAICYADRQYGDFDEVQLPPY